MSTDELFKNRPFIMYSILWMVGAGALAVLYFFTQNIYPSFIEQLVKNTEHEAVRVGQLLKKSVIGELQPDRFIVSEDVKQELLLI